jgi:hypothetical protein
MPQTNAGFSPCSAARSAFVPRFPVCRNSAVKRRASVLTYNNIYFVKVTSKNRLQVIRPVSGTIEIDGNSGHFHHRLPSRAWSPMSKKSGKNAVKSHLNALENEAKSHIVNQVAHNLHTPPPGGVAFSRWPWMVENRSSGRRAVRAWDSGAGRASTGRPDGGARRRRSVHPPA